MKKLKIWLKIDIFGELALRHVNLLFQKTTADDDYDEYPDSLFMFSSIVLSLSKLGLTNFNYFPCPDCF